RVEQMKKDVEDVYVLDQFTNPANPDAHFRWTGCIKRGEQGKDDCDNVFQWCREVSEFRALCAGEGRVRQHQHDLLMFSSRQ
uniref:Uncharacterized protein n=1 Tax=Aegilops tauschii subsp. strangulata TaxID=200361 RepID=A0A453NSY4_AEGTS